MCDFGKSSIWARFAVACLGLAAAASAHATLIGDSVNMALVSSGDGISLQDNGILVGAGIEMAPANNTTIGGDGTPNSTPMLANDFVDIQADRLIFRLENGSGNGTTGYASGAYWEISDLDDSLGPISGFDVFLSNITNFTAANDVLFSGGDTFRVFISSLVIGGLNAGVYGDIEIRLRTGITPPPPVPEPGSLALLALGLGALGIARRRTTDR